MKMNGYLKDKALSLFVFGITAVLSASFLSVLAVELNVIILVEALHLSGFAVVLALELLIKMPYYNSLLDILDELEEKTYLIEMIKRPSFYEGKLMHRILKENSRYMNNMIADLQLEQIEYNNYIETWVHEVKTPISVSKLLIENNRNEITISLEEEIDKIEEYVEQVLYYTKSGSLEQDYRMKKIPLKESVKAVLKKCAKMMITGGIAPRLVNLEVWVISDSKWLEFILSQIVSNAVKYKSRERKPEVVFEGKIRKNTVILAVCDNGIGIPGEDIGKVFQKGFTGGNGRLYKKSTGMGLYLCHQLCKKMGITITVSSVFGEGTSVVLEIPKANCDEEKR